MSLIYQPRGAAREYASLACNVYSGCVHGCLYCFGPNVLHKSKDEFHTPTLRPFDFVAALRKEAEDLYKRGITGQVHLCFTCDPYQPLEAEQKLTRQTIEVLHEYGFSVAILSKGGKLALRDLELFNPLDAYAITLVFSKQADADKWEPYAASPQERFDTLAVFHQTHIPTWISLEPVIDPKQTLHIIDRTREYVDHFKVGKLNHRPEIEQTINWREFGLAAIKDLERFGYREITNPDDGQYANVRNKTYYIKKALRKAMEQG